MVLLFLTEKINTKLKLTTKHIEKQRGSNGHSQSQKTNGATGAIWYG